MNSHIWIIMLSIILHCTLDTCFNPQIISIKLFGLSMSMSIHNHRLRSWGIISPGVDQGENLILYLNHCAEACEQNTI